MTNSTAQTGVLLVNLGTPASTSVGDVRRYLREFLSDPRVIDISAPARWLLVNAIIAPFRAPRSAVQYRKIWGAEGSPLLTNGLALRDALERELGDDVAVEFAMRYGEPGIGAALDRLAEQKLERLVVLPLFPQYASSSSASAIARVEELAATRSGLPTLEFVEDFFVDAGFINALASVAQPALDAFRPDFLLMSYHGLPERQILRLDDLSAHCSFSEACCASIGPKNRRCYRAQCYASSRALAAKLELDDDAWTVAFQSRLGRTPWIQPYTDEVLPELAQRGVRRLAVVCPSFVADCLETLEEIGVRAAEQWSELGGEALQLVPCVNADPSFVHAIAGMLGSSDG